MMWILTANTNTARVYQLEKLIEEMTLLQELNHPENKLKISEFTTDRPGHYKTDSSGGGAYSPHSNPKEVAMDNFAREISILLKEGRNSNKYKSLIIVSLPHMMGLLSKHLDPMYKNL